MSPIATSSLVSNGDGPSPTSPLKPAVLDDPSTTTTTTTTTSTSASDSDPSGSGPWLVPPQPPLPPAPLHLYHDGLKTCGLTPPLPQCILPPSAFPEEITGETVWTGEYMSQHKDEWVRGFTAEEVREIGAAADRFIQSGVDLTGIKRELFPLPSLGPYFTQLKHSTILNGRGFILFKNIPVDEWGTHKSAVAYMGIGTYFGYFTSQNGKGHVLGHVQDLSKQVASASNTSNGTKLGGTSVDAPAPVRIYRTNKRQHFHTDSSDLVGLLCMAKSQSGGESDIVSTHHLYNTLRREYPDVWGLVVRDIWYFDRKGEISQGEQGWYRSFMFGQTNDSDPAQRRVFNRFDPLNLTTLSRYSSGPDPQVPPLSPEQVRALEVVESTAKRLSLHMVLEPGDIQLLANTHVLHARTAYTDWPVGSVDEEGRPRKQRQLMRLWLATPEDEGGWRLPYWDSRQKKRAGIQVDDTRAVCPLTAE